MTNALDFTADELAEHFEYLDALRESGVTNMFGAGPYLVRDCGLEKADAGAVLSAWMGSFDPDKSALDRARTQSAEAK